VDGGSGTSAFRPSVTAVTTWEVPGYDVLELLGFGTTGEVWRARERSSGALVALRRLAGGDREAVADVRRASTVVRSLPSPHLVRLRTTTRAGRDDVLVLDHAAGGSLAALLADRGRLAPGEVVTLLAPLAEALGQAHRHRVVHGHLRASSVLLSAAGMPLLDGLGLTALKDPGDSHDPTGGLGATADVWALGALGHRLLTGAEPGTTPLSVLAATAPVPLVRALESALSFDPAARPTADDLAAALLAACPALPVGGVPALSAPEVTRRSLLPHRPQRRVLLAAGCAAALALVVAVGWAWGSRSAGSAATVRAASSVGGAALVTRTAPRTDWEALLRRLDTTREAAFAHADAAWLAEVYASSSPLLAADTRALGALAAQQQAALGVRHEVVRVVLLRATADRAELQVTEALTAYRVVDSAGRVVRSHAASPAVRHLLVLQRQDAGWRLAEVRVAA
jgi:hypothetical protein